MSGPSAQQQQLSNEQSAFYQEAMQESSQAFSEQQGLLKLLQSVYDPILQKGPNQLGFSTQEDNALNAQAVESTATNYAGAERAVNEQEAAASGDNPLPTGAEDQLKEEFAASSANQESEEESQILQADYNQGFQEFTNAGEALSTASGQLNPAQYENAATSAGSAAETTDAALVQESNSWENAALGAVGSIGSAVVSENPGNIFG